MTTDEGVSVAADKGPEAALLIDTENLFYVYARSDDEQFRDLDLPGIERARLGWSNPREQAQLSLRAVIDWAEIVVGDRAITTKLSFGKVDDPGCKLLANHITVEWSTIDGERFFTPRSDAGWLAHVRSGDHKDAADLDLIAEFHRLRASASPAVDTFVFGGSDGRLRDALHGVLWGKQVPPGWWTEPRENRARADLGAATYDARGNPVQEEIVRFAFVIDGRNAYEMRYNRWGRLLNRANEAMLRRKECRWRPPGTNAPSRWFFATLAEIRTLQDEAARRSPEAVSATTRRATPRALAATVRPPWLELADWFLSPKAEKRLRTGKPTRGEIERKRGALMKALPEHLRPHLDAMMSRWADVFASHPDAADSYDDVGPTSPNWRKKLAAAMLVPIAKSDPSLTAVHRADDAFQLARQWLGFQEEPRDA